MPLLATHLTSAEIAAEWFVSVHAGKSQQASRYRKLETSSRSQEVRPGTCTTMAMSPDRVLAPTR